MKGREYTFRKWHSLMGVIPVGVFLTQHLIVNNFATRGAEAFNKAAGFMGSSSIPLCVRNFHHFFTYSVPCYLWTYILHLQLRTMR